MVLYPLEVELNDFTAVRQLGILFSVLFSVALRSEARWSFGMYFFLSVVFFSIDPLYSEMLLDIRERGKYHPGAWRCIVASATYCILLAKYFIKLTNVHFILTIGIVRSQHFRS